MIQDLSGLLWIFVGIGVLALGLVLIFGTMMWRRKRLSHPRGTKARAPGPAPEGAWDDEPAVRKQYPDRP